MPRIATSARARTGLQDRAREYRSTAMSNHRDRKDLPAEDDRNRPPETPEHRKHRKQHESDNQDEALDETFPASDPRSEEHTSELQSLMRISSAVFCLQKKTTNDKKKK